VAEEIILNTNATIKTVAGVPCFISSKDEIHIPLKSDFNSQDEYYSTVFHELIHWTGTKERLDRSLNDGFSNKESYAFEELIAEMGASFLSAHVEIKYTNQHASYIQSWLRILNGDKKAIFKAARLAQNAVDYILEFK